MKRTDKKNRQEYTIGEENILEVKDLRVNIKVDDYVLNAVRGVSFTMKKGETLGLVGESGCGKSVTSKEILGINPNNCDSTGQVLFRTKSGKVLNLLTLDKDGEVYDEKVEQKKYAVYCREAKKKETTPLSFEEWRQLPEEQR